MSVCFENVCLYSVPVNLMTSLNKVERPADFFLCYTDFPFNVFEGLTLTYNDHYSSEAGSVNSASATISSTFMSAYC